VAYWPMMSSFESHSDILYICTGNKWTLVYREGKDGEHILEECSRWGTGNRRVDSSSLDSGQVDLRVAVFTSHGLAQKFCTSLYINWTSARRVENIDQHLRIQTPNEEAILGLYARPAIPEAIYTYKDITYCRIKFEILFGRFLPREA